MRDFSSCFSENAIQVASNKSSCAPPTPTPTPIPSIQIAVTCVYKTTLSTQAHLLTTLTWAKNTTTQTQTLTINFGDDLNPSPTFKLNTNNNSLLFKTKTKGKKSFLSNNFKLQLFWDLSTAHYTTGPEPVQGYYILILVDSQLGLLLGDMTQQTLMEKLKIDEATPVAKFSLISRREYFSANTLYSNKTKFCENGIGHEILIRCSGVRRQVLSVYVDEKVVMRVKKLEWKFRGNHSILVDDLLVDLMWDVHDWFFNPGKEASAVFMFKTRSGVDTKLWLEEEKINEFSLLIYACKGQ